MQNHRSQTHASAGHGHYGALALMALLSFIAMYALMYAMVDVLDNVIPNHNQLYMAGLMTAPMVLIELLLMRGMYGNARLNAVASLGAVLLGLACWFAIRQQAAIGDEQLLKSMIPHHAGAVLMCQQAKLTDPDNRRLCEHIIRSQQSEIDQMKARLRNSSRMTPGPT